VDGIAEEAEDQAEEADVAKGDTPTLAAGAGTVLGSGFGITVGVIIDTGTAWAAIRGLCRMKLPSLSLVGSAESPAVFFEALAFGVGFTVKFEGTAIVRVGSATGAGCKGL